MCSTIQIYTEMEERNEHLKVYGSNFAIDEICLAETEKRQLEKRFGKQESILSRNSVFGTVTVSQQPRRTNTNTQEKRKNSSNLQDGISYTINSAVATNHKELCKLYPYNCKIGPPSPSKLTTTRNQTPRPYLSHQNSRFSDNNYNYNYNDAAVYYPSSYVKTYQNMSFNENYVDDIFIENVQEHKVYMDFLKEV